MCIPPKDKKRVKKSLHTARALGPLPVLRSFDDERAEARFVADEIKRLVVCMEGMLKWDDFAILCKLYVSKCLRGRSQFVVEQQCVSTRFREFLRASYSSEGFLTES